MAIEADATTWPSLLTDTELASLVTAMVLAADAKQQQVQQQQCRC
jgi:hypothetical protein